MRGVVSFGVESAALANNFSSMVAFNRIHCGLWDLGAELSLFRQKF